MYNMKRIGPKIDPCGTPHSILKKDDEVYIFRQGSLHIAHSRSHFDLSTNSHLH